MRKASRFRVRGGVGEAEIARLREMDDRRRAEEAADRKRYGVPGPHVHHKLSPAEIAAVELVRRRNAQVEGGERR